MKTFKQQSIGELATEYEEELKQKITAKYEELKKMSTNKITVSFINLDYTFLERV